MEGAKDLGVVRVLKWKAQGNTKLDFVDKGPLDLVAKNKIGYTIKNTGTDNIVSGKLQLRVTKTRGDAEVKIGGQKLDVGNNTLIDLKGAIKNNNRTKDFQLDIEGNGGNSAEFELQLIYDGVDVAVKKVTWKATLDIQLDFVDKGQLDLVANNPVNYAIKNTGADKTEKDKISIQIKKISGDKKVKIGGKEINVGKTVSISLKSENIEIKNGDIDKALSLLIEDNGGTAAEFELQLIYKGKPVAGTKKVTWKKS